MHSHSRVECFVTCPYKYKLRYKDKLQLEEGFAPDNPLTIGLAMHQALETSYEDAEQDYYNKFNIIDDRHINEMIKVKHWSKKVHEIIDSLNIFAKEYDLESDDGFRGKIDLITKNRNGSVDIIDYKYSNTVLDWLDSPQLHLYKYYLEKQGFKVNKLGYIIIPKTKAKMRDNECIEKYRLRLRQALSQLEIRLVPIEYNSKKVESYFKNKLDMETCVRYNRHISNNCYFCSYQKICKGDCEMKLPACERRDIKVIKKRKIWIYGGAFSGKTTMLDDAPNPLNLNTDGNVQFVTMPYIPIKDIVTMKGRLSERTLAWQVFKDTIEELEKKQNEYKTIIVDLIEDTYEMCRLYKYNELGITHESDDSFKAWDKIRTEFLSTIRRFFNLDYENLVIISHEDKSKDLTKSSGDKVSLIKPNIQDKVANKLAGMVDIVARVVVEGDKRTLDFKTNQNIFGGGRLKGVKKTSVPLNWNELMKIYDEANEGRATSRI